MFSPASSSSSFSNNLGSSKSESSSKSAANPEIISLPCAHLFHASCLAPWFAQHGQTTCPTCRFDVDPQGAVWYGGDSYSIAYARATGLDYANLRNDAAASELEWAPPPAPGPTIRDRVERREREAGMRCDAAACRVGPSDDDPFIEILEKAERTNVINTGPKGRRGAGKACTRMFHRSCLVRCRLKVLRNCWPKLMGGRWRAKRRRCG
ncbi:hypothetical protein K438DRAFT_1855965, partial [Mycena galopus ATCC 62051]